MIFEIFMALAGGAYVTGTAMSENVKRVQHRQNMEAMGYNLERQQQLERMVHSAYPTEREKFDELVGKPFNRNNEREVHDAIETIAQKEGWRYATIEELFRV